MQKDTEDGVWGEGEKRPPRPPGEEDGGDIKSKGSSKGDEAERDGDRLLTPPTFLLISVQHSSFGSKSSVYSETAESYKD